MTVRFAFEFNGVYVQVANGVVCLQRGENGRKLEGLAAIAELRARLC